MISQPIRQTRTARSRDAGGSILWLLLLLAAFVGVQVCYWHAAAILVGGLAELAHAGIDLLHLVIGF